MRVSASYIIVRRGSFLLWWLIMLLLPWFTFDVKRRLQAQMARKRPGSGNYPEDVKRMHRINSGMVKLSCSIIICRNRTLGWALIINHGLNL
jgi:hypothetical protein